MGNTSPQTNSNRSLRTTTTTKNDSQYPALKKSRSLREYTRSSTLINSSTTNSTRRNVSLPRPQSMAPTDGEIIDICALRCELPVQETISDDEISKRNINNEGEQHFLKQLDYIHSCVRKDKGLFGKLFNVTMFLNDIYYSI
jgi:hypothetical protein